MSSARKNQFRVTAAWLLAWIGVWLLVTAEIYQKHAHKIFDLRVRAVKEAALLKEESTNSLNTLEQNLRRKAREAATRQNVELETAWGGPVAAAFKNPDFSIRDALQHAAEACAPTN